MLRFIILMLFPLLVNANSCVVLMYHHFSDSTPKSTSISPKLFAEHLQYLSDNNFNVLPLVEVLQGLQAKNLPKKCVSLTADDAYLSIYENAYSLLKKYQMSMAVFVSTKAIDNQYKKMMSWQQMSDIAGEYIAFYNHSLAHTHWLDLNESEVKTQIEQAQKRLQEELQVREKILAYPYGEANLSAYQQVKKLGYTAFGQQSGVVSVESDLQNLPRFPMAAQFAEMPAFQQKVNTLPMPLVQARTNPVIDENNNPPELGLTFKVKLEKSQLNCFANSEVNIRWISDKKVSIRAKRPLTDRRSKYNCTYPSPERGRYYWHSVQWINPKIAEH